MKNYLYIITLCFLACFVTACDDELEDFNGPYSVIVTGPMEVEPQTTETYKLGTYANPETYTWTVTGPAAIVGTNKGSVVKISFSTVGDVSLTVTNGTDTSVIGITVADIEPEAEATLSGTGVLKNGSIDTVFLSFPTPLQANPTIAMVADTEDSQFGEGSAFNSGSLGPIVKLDASTYYALYTAGTGNGTPEALIKGVQATEDYGGDKIDSTYIQLFRVDNVAPIADLTYSTVNANDSTVVTVTATFNDEVTFKSPLDSALLIRFSGAGAATEKDTLVATSDPHVYTYKYTTNGEGNGTVTVMLDNITDLGGNDLASTTHTNVLKIDNIPPIVLGTATDSGDFVTLSILGDGSGTYLILDSDEDAPADAEELLTATLGDNVATGSIDVGDPKTIVIPAGSYTVYFLTEDAAGNYSPVNSDDLDVD